MHGKPYYGRRAQFYDVLASGYAIAQIATMPNDHSGTVTRDVTMTLVRYQAGFAAHHVGLMSKLAGAIAVALLDGDRRFISAVGV